MADRVFSSIVGALVLLALTVPISACQPDTDICTPSGLPLDEAKGVTTAATKSREPANGVDIVLDASAGMAGFVKANSGEPRRFPVVLSQLPEVLTVAVPMTGAANFHKLGNNGGVNPIRPDDYASAWQNCGARCLFGGNSDLADWLERHAQGRGGMSRTHLVAVVTDLLHDGGVDRGAGGPIGRGLAHLVASGQTVAVIGVRSAFTGKIFDLPGGEYAGPNRRGFSGSLPFYVLLIGPQPSLLEAVEKLHGSLVEALADDPSAMHIEIFHPPEAPAINSFDIIVDDPQAKREQAKPLPFLAPQRQFSLPLGATGVNFAIDGLAPNKGGIDRGTSIAAKFLAFDHSHATTGCAAAWRDQTQRLRGPVTLDGGRVGVTFAPDAPPLLPGTQYLLQLTVMVDDKGSSRSFAWATDWTVTLDKRAKVEAAISSGQSNFFPTANLSTILQNIEIASRPPSSNGVVTKAFAFTIKP